MFYTIYKITNLLNNKIYIGKHKTKNLSDGYMGSGINIDRAIKKYGVENFTKEILYVFDNEKEMNSKEKEIVAEDFVKESTNYNICPGGQGGWGYYNNNFENGMLGKSQSEKQKKTAKKTMLSLHEKLYNNEIEKKKWKESLIGRAPSFKGKTHTEEWKQNHSKIMKEKQSGSKNSQYGTIWITNGIENKKIGKDTIIPNGWYKGRKIK